MKESDAKRKWCPMVRHSNDVDEYASNRSVSPNASDPVGPGTWNKCIGADCMMWIEGTKLVDAETKEYEGDCGLKR